ncbi:GH32 C-terminal domain-containing protein [Saccharibacillus deserti]|uniref:GH32 C-terminal domain-containing protein n=1 Tax=Saccharibacillus deserti TaxID=1634444 RepID=UPI001551DD16|nr:GH32 C-terminal domain-containing protein [Saccharibacillus deserti]
MKTYKPASSLLCAVLLLGVLPTGGLQAAESAENESVNPALRKSEAQQAESLPNPTAAAALSDLSAQTVQEPIWNHNFDSVIIREGNWTADDRGIRGTAENGSAAVRMHAVSPSERMVFRGDISPGSADTSAGLVFLAGSGGTDGYTALLDRGQGRVRARLLGPGGANMAESAGTYPSEDGVKHRLEIVVEDGRARLYVDGYAEAAIEAGGISPGMPPGGLSAGLTAVRGTAVFQDTYLTPTADYYGETYRPAYHYSPPRGSASDPNGMIYYQGEYHLFHQDGGRWAHAVSPDMLHWKSLPLALEWNDLGHIWSGSAVADPDNRSGLFDGSPDGGGLIAYYTSYNPEAPGGNQRIGIAYSADRGRTWHYPQDRPIVIENPGKNGDDPGSWDFRDPKVVRDEARGRWVMVVSGGDHIRFFTSTNLTDWTLTDNFGYGGYVRGGVWECPDLFPLPVDGTGETRWVLMISTGANPATEGSDAEYFVGQLTDDGKFVNDHAAGQVLKTDWGKEFYASSSFTDAPNGRVVTMAWMTNWDYPFAFPTFGWQGVLSLPRELSLTRTGEGVRLVQRPIGELDSLRRELRTVGRATVAAGSPNPLQGLSAGAYEIEAELELPAEGAADSFGFRVREGGGQHTDIAYSVEEAKLSVDRSASGATDFSPLLDLRQEAQLRPENGILKLRIFVDESSAEVFAGEGRTVFSDLIFPDAASRGMSFYAQGGEVKIRSIRVHALDSVWKKQAGEELVLNASEVELGPNEERALSAAARTSSSVEGSLNWTSSDPSVVSVSAAEEGSAVLRAVGAGEASVTVSAANGASGTARVVVHGGTFVSDLGKLSPTPSSASWIVTEDGMRGKHIGDTAAMSARTAGDFTYESTVKLGSGGGAASLLFRADAAGGSGYYLNLDPNMDAVRLFYKMNGSFAERQVLGTSPASVVPGGTYRLKVQAKGPRIRAWLDGKAVIDVQDGTFASGQFGLHAFGGQASFQNARITHASAAKLESFALINRESARVLAVSAPARGSAVDLRQAEKRGNPLWTAVPTGLADGSVSLRTPEGQALDLDTGRGTLQIYDYLGYDNQRWIIRKKGGQTFLLNAANGLALTSGSGGGPSLSAYDPDNRAQQWKLKK